MTCLSGDPVTCGADLQAALDAGGTIHVCPGRYRGGFELTTAVTIIGAGQGAGAGSNTILDVTGGGVVLEIPAVVGPVVLERLRLTGAAAQSGGGIQQYGTTLRMTECTLTGNVGQPGGGIYVLENRTLEMVRCTVSDNEGDGGGAGIVTFGTTTLTDCLLEKNLAQGPGGGLWIRGGTTTLLGSTQVRDNEATTTGGGISLTGGTLEIAETCRVTGNAAAKGGGIYNGGGTVILQGAAPSPIVVNNCPNNCNFVETCAVDPTSNFCLPPPD